MLIHPMPNNKPARLSEELEEEGFAVLRQAVPQSAIASIAAALEPHFQKTPRCEGDFYGWKTTRVGGLLDKAPQVSELVLHDECLGLANTALSPLCDCIQLNLTQGVRIHPGERMQAPHRDEEMWPCEPKSGHWLINVMWPLTAFTEGNGATRVWPRSHRQALERSTNPAESIAVEMAPGDALVFLGSLTHAAGANRSPTARSGIIISYCLGWLKQYENQYLAYDAQTVLEFAEPLQRLLGYQVHRPNLGGVDGCDPLLTLNNRGAARGHKDALPAAIARDLAALYEPGGVLQSS
jgi:ectoine hydroxylase-related dioxygenase (phytanoyl-CoA dioxygenase family)